MPFKIPKIPPQLLDFGREILHYKNVRYYELLRIINIYCLNCGAFPLSVDKRTGLLYKHKSRLQWVYFYATSILQLVAWLILTKWYWVKWKGSEEGFDAPLWELLMMGYFFAMFGLLFMSQWLAYSRRIGFLNVGNASIQLERKFRNEGYRNYGKLLIVATTLTLFCAVLLAPILFFMLASLYPCLEFLVGWQILDCNSDPGIFGRLIVASIEAWHWWILCSPVMFAQIFGSVYPAVVTQIYLEYLQRDIVQGNLESMKKFRTASILMKWTNYNYRFPLMWMLYVGWTIAEIVALFIVIRLRDDLPLPIFFFFLLLASEGYLVIHVIFPVYSKPYVGSILFKEAVLKRRVSIKTKGNGSQKDVKWIRCFLRSCEPIKVIAAGQGSFVDGTTSLVLWQFCVDYLVTLLLL